MQIFEQKALELVATALSEEYGVKVVCGGFRAQTKRDANGLPVITIPAVPIYDANYRLLIRGYIDHEIGHIRFSDDKLIQEGILEDASISGAIKAIASIYEDVLVDAKMGECFIGSRRNLRKLALLLYDQKAAQPPNGATVRKNLLQGIVKPREMPWHIWNAALQYILYSARSGTLAKLAPRRDAWRRELEVMAPDLPNLLDPIIARLPAEGIDSAANLGLARETVHIIRDYLRDKWDSGMEHLTRETVLELSWLLRNGGAAREAMDMGNAASQALDEIIQEMDNLPEQLVCIRHPMGSTIWNERLLPLSDLERQEALQASSKMAAQMHALLQTHILNREGPFRQGKLHTRNLHKLFIGRDDVFRRDTERRGLDTSIVVCVDMSGSMRFDNKAIMASKALYAVADSLARIQGLDLHILGFYDNNMVELHTPNAPLSQRMKIIPDGGTLCGAALREAAQSFGPKKTRRKLVIMITDGDANDPDNFREAIEDLDRNGLEIMGIGIHDNHILDYLPRDDCRVITDLRELAGVILELLRKKMGIRP